MMFFGTQSIFTNSTFFNFLLFLQKLSDFPDKETEAQ